MPRPSDDDRPADAMAVVERYRRRERPARALMAVIVVALFLATYVATWLLPAVAVAAVLFVVVRAPVLRPHGSARLRTDADPDEVRSDFEGPMPPVLAFQWGVAQNVTADDGVATYHVSSVSGLRDAEVTVHSETRPVEAGTRVELDVRVNGEPWGNYVATISDGDGETVVDVDYVADRRFGLRRLPQQLFAHRYRNAALESQGYAVVERDSHLW